MLTEQEVREIAKALGYELNRTPEGFELVREYSDEEEVIESPTLEPLVDFLRQ